MKTYVGTKIIKAEPMTLADFNLKYRNPGTETVPADKSVKEGYHVKYEDGYNAWSPKEVFERCYRPITSSERVLMSEGEGSYVC